MINTRIKSRNGKRTKGNGKASVPPVVYARTLYNVLLSYEQPIILKIGTLNVHRGWETIEKTVQVEAYCKDDAHSKAFVETRDEMVKQFPNHNREDFNIQVKRVDELSQAVYMRRIGAPELFAVTV